MDMNDNHKIHNTRITLKEVLDIRGYDTSTIAELSLEDVIKLKESSDETNLCNFSVSHKDIPEWKLHVIFYKFPQKITNNTSISKATLEADIKEFYTTINQEDNMMIIIPSKITTAYKTYISWIDKINISTYDTKDKDLVKKITDDKNYSDRHLHHIQIFNINSFVINKLKHEMVPHHEKITDDTEIKKTLMENDVDNITQFPVILKHDVIGELLGMVPNDLVKITRYSNTSGVSIFYRICK